MDLGLEGKTALVTGGSKGIGRAVARALAGEGADVMLCARDPAALEQAAKFVYGETGRTALTCAADLGTPRGVSEAIAAAIAGLGRIDVLVNNAGAIPGGDFLSMSDEDWVRGWDLKLSGYIRMAREVLPHMTRNGGGRIVNVIGIAARNPTTTYMMGGAANAALVNFTKSLADLGAPSNVLVNAVSPGPVRTERYQSLMRQQAEALGKTIEEYERQQSAALPLGRVARPEEVADVVCFLASERASFVTGITVTVDGGISRGVYL